MASVYKLASGIWQLALMRNGKRRSVMLGRMTKRKAEQIKAHVTELEQWRKLRLSPEPSTRLWLSSLPGNSPVAKFLADSGLIEATPDAEISVILDNYIKSRVDLKASSLTVCRRARNHAVETFGGRSVSSITPGEAEDWRRHMLATQAATTAGRMVDMVKTMVADAVRRGHASSNPFAGLKGTKKSNPENTRFIEASTVRRLMEALPDDHWRLFIALGRWGGVRLPSEAMAMRHQDIEWERQRITVVAGKTKQHRVMPLFPELVDPIRAVGLSGGEWLIRRDFPGNPRTTIYKALKRIGVKPWPRLLNNLRASRATEIARQYGPHVEAAWLGHSAKVSQEHYLSVTDDIFAAAAKQRG